MKILLIDDEPDVLRHMKKALQILGHTCDSFEDPMEALENFSPEKYGIVISDVLMPAMNGFAVADKIRLIAPEAKVLLVSGHSGDALGEMAVSHNPVVCMRKPIDVHILKMVLDNMARQSAS